MVKSKLSTIVIELNEHRYVISNVIVESGKHVRASLPFPVQLISSPRVSVTLIGKLGKVTVSEGAAPLTTIDNISRSGLLGSIASEVSLITAWPIGGVPEHFDGAVAATTNKEVQIDVCACAGRATIATVGGAHLSSPRREISVSKYSLAFLISDFIANRPLILVSLTCRLGPVPPNPEAHLIDKGNLQQALFWRIKPHRQYFRHYLFVQTKVEPSVVRHPLS